MMKKGLFRLWLVASVAWFIFTAMRTWQTWPEEDVLWNNGITSRQEAIFNAALLASVPAFALLFAFMMIWVARGFERE